MKLSVDSERFVTALKAVILAASVDPDSPHMNCVRLGFINGSERLTLAATNGHWAAEYTFPVGTFRDVEDPSSVLLFLDDAKDAIKKIGKSVVPLEIEIGETIQLFHGTTRLMYQPNASHFPPLEERTPAAWCRDVLPEGVLGLSADLLADVTKAFQILRENKKNTEAMHFDFGGELDPIRITNERDFLAVVMPCRGVIARTKPLQKKAPKTAIAARAVRA